MTALRPKSGMPYTRAEIDALFEHLPDEPFQTSAIRAAVEATGIWRGRNHHPGVIAQTIRILLLARGEFVIARRDGPRHVWLMKGARAAVQAPRQPMIGMSLIATRLTHKIGRHVRVPLEPTTRVDDVLDRLRPIVAECLAFHQHASDLVTSS